MPAMPFASRWPETLRAACVAAVLDHPRMSAARAAELAAAGTLAQGLEAHPVPVGTVRDWVRDEKQRRRGAAAVSAGPLAQLEQSAARLAALVERETARAERQSTRGNLDAARLVTLARAGVECARMARACGSGSGAAPAKDAPADGAAERPASFLEGLAAAADG